MEELLKYFTALEQRLAALEQNNAALAEQVTHFKTKTAALEEEIAALQDSLISLSQAPQHTAELESDDEPEVEVELILPEDNEPEPEEDNEPQEEQPENRNSEPQEVPVEEHEEPAPQQTTLFGAPVKDIKKAISLGDRFLFQRELFNQNGELMQKTLEDLNLCASLDEAHAYIDKHFKWDKDSTTYSLFEHILNRRF